MLTCTLFRFPDLVENFCNSILVTKLVGNILSFTLNEDKNWQPILAYKSLLLDSSLMEFHKNYNEIERNHKSTMIDRTNLIG